MQVKITVREDPNTVEVEYLDQKHTAVWKDEERLSKVVGSRDLLRAAMVAWCGEAEFTLEDTALSEQGGGYWAP